MDIVAVYCDLDDFYQAFAPTWQQHLLPAPGRHRRRASRLSPSEIMTLVIAFHDSDYRTFKHFYRKEVCRHWRAEFPDLVSYQRLIECLPARRAGSLSGLSAYASGTHAGDCLYR